MRQPFDTDLDDGVLRLPEICRLGGFGMTKARELIAEKKLRAVKIGRITAVRRSAWRAFLADLPPADITA